MKKLAIMTAVLITGLSLSSCGQSVDTQSKSYRAGYGNAKWVYSWSPKPPKDFVASDFCEAIFPRFDVLRLKNPDGSKFVIRHHYLKSDWLAGCAQFYRDSQ